MRVIFITSYIKTSYNTSINITQMVEIRKALGGLPRRVTNYEDKTTSQYKYYTDGGNSEGIG
jgi:hypothetical protein